MHYRCTSCGNLTRFDVVERTRTASYHHYTVGGELTIDEVTVLDRVVESVTCRWCGSGDAVVPVDTDQGGVASDPPAETDDGGRAASDAPHEPPS